MNLQPILKSKIVTVGLILAFSVTAFITFQLYWQKHQVDTEIKRLEDQANAYKNDNQQLSELIKYLDTPEYKEKEAREKLNLKKEGEQVVVIPPGSESDGIVSGASTDSAPNPKKWFNYFFNN